MLHKGDLFTTTEAKSINATEPIIQLNQAVKKKEEQVASAIGEGVDF
jgi:hypothetical protein